VAIGPANVTQRAEISASVGVSPLGTSIAGGGKNSSPTTTDTTYAYYRFDAFAIRPGSLETSADSFTFPEFKVEVMEGPIAILPFNLSVQALSASSLRLTWNSVSGLTYKVLSRSTITSNETTNATILATGSSTSYTNLPLSGARRFFRVVATP